MLRADLRRYVVTRRSSRPRSREHFNFAAATAPEFASRFVHRFHPLLRGEPPAAARLSRDILGVSTPPNNPSQTAENQFDLTDREYLRGSVSTSCARVSTRFEATRRRAPNCREPEAAHRVSHMRRLIANVDSLRGRLVSTSSTRTRSNWRLELRAWRNST